MKIITATSYTVGRNEKWKWSHSVVSDSLQPMDCSLWLLCPWDFPGKNTGMGSHTLLQGIFPPRDQTQVSHIVGGFFTRWATKAILQSVQSLSRVQLFADPWTAAGQASLSITNFQNLPKLMSIELVMPSNHLILCHPLLLPPSIFPSIRVFSNESVLRIRWAKDWSFIYNISPSNEYSGPTSFRIDQLDLLAGHGTPRVFSNTTVQKHQFFGTQLSL